MQPVSIRLAAAATTCALAAGILVFTTDVRPASAAPVVVPFEFTGASVLFEVPADVCSIDVEVLGAGGGDTPGQLPEPGFGARVADSLGTTPNETLIVTVGGRGGDGAEDVPDEPKVVPGGSAGFNGGGAGGDVTTDENTTLAASGGGGGGASDIRRQDFELLVAAAGGGGAARGKAGDGGDVGHSAAGVLVAQGGTKTEGGWADPNSDGTTTALSGKLLFGGAGAPAVPEEISTPLESGGGGGGGWFGGGGGRRTLSNNPMPGFDLAHGGGGGSSLASPAGTVVDGVNEGHGRITITYEVDPGCAGEVTASADARCDGTAALVDIALANDSGSDREVSLRADELVFVGSVDVGDGATKDVSLPFPDGLGPAAQLHVVDVESGVELSTSAFPTMPSCGDDVIDPADPVIARPTFAG